MLHFDLPPHHGKDRYALVRCFGSLNLGRGVYFYGFDKGDACRRQSNLKYLLICFIIENGK